jgi:hypothetical protein
MEEIVYAENYSNTNNQNHNPERDYYLLFLENKQYKSNNALLAEKLREMERKIKILTFPCSEVQIFKIRTR